MNENKKDVTGLTTEQVCESRKKNGQNLISHKKENPVVSSLKELVKEPMILLLVMAASVYFITGNSGDGFFLLSAVVLVATISLYQESRSRNALEKLKDLTQPLSKVIREGKTIEIKTEEIVLGDTILIEEGTSIPADGKIIQSNDFSVSESILTGESFPIIKDATKEDAFVYSGTKVSSGTAFAIVTAIGESTKLGKIGKSLESIKEEKTPLEIKIHDFVKKMIIAGAIVFLIFWGINFIKSHDFLDSLLKALTIAMSILPEEIPVAFTTFMAIGAWRLMKMGIVVKQMKTVETLGSATVICTDKTGTITENKMSVAKIYILATNEIVSKDSPLNKDGLELISLAMWSSEPVPFDPMEIALHGYYEQNHSSDDRKNFLLIHEYPLGGKPPMMTHIFSNDEGKKIIAAKGAPEALMNVSNLSSSDRIKIEDALNSITIEGYRVLGVGECNYTGSDYPVNQQEFKFQFKGLVAFYDPPKKNIKEVFERFYSAGISVKIITGDNAATTTAIAKQIGFKGYENSITGEELMKLNDRELQEKVGSTNLFTRMFPEAKLKIINALKENKEIVAMTGDGVNDGPALKAAHIGIAMGKKGTEIAKQSASLILVDDDLSKMLDAVASGRKIYSNLKKAIQYIISIHIPLILTVFFPLALGWIYPTLFSPLHIIFLELIMGPTCSIIYENEPYEKNTMTEKPRPIDVSFFNSKELTTSIIQGLMITIGTLSTYLYAVSLHLNESTTRTMVFVVLIAANIILTLVNRSFFYSIFTTLKYKNNLVLLIISITIALTSILIYISPVATFFKLTPLNLFQGLISIGIGIVSVIWFEIVKWIIRIKKEKLKPIN